MKMTAAVLCVIFSLTLVGFTQQRLRADRTITNADLEKHKQKRLDAERDYRENYDRMGFPSPEELEEQRERDMQARLDLSRQLRESRLEESRIRLENERIALEAARINAERRASEGYFPAAPWGVYGGYYGTGFYGNHGRRNFGKFGRGAVFGIPLYRATPAGVFPAGTLRPRTGGIPRSGRRGPRLR